MRVCLQKFDMQPLYGLISFLQVSNGSLTLEKTSSYGHGYLQQ